MSIQPKEVLFYAVTAILAVAAAVFHSPLFGFAAVAALGVSLVAEAVREKLMAMKNINLTIPEVELRRLADAEARITAIEYGIKNRGF